MSISEKEYLREIKEIERKYKKITKDISFVFPRAYNAEKEKEIFFRAIADDEIYNPQLKFRRRRFPSKAIEELEDFKINTSNDLYGFKELYVNKIRTRLDLIKCFYKWGDDESAKYAISHYGKPSFWILQKAKSFCRTYKRETIKFKTLTPQIAGERIQREAKRLTGDSIKVNFQILPNKANMNIKAKTLNLNPKQRFTSRDVRRLKVHEIGTHYMRYYNGRIQGLDILSDGGTYGYTITEEGLAAYMEELMGVSSRAQMYIYAGRVIATYYAPKKSFCSIYKILKKYGFKDDDAYSITLRAKRNISDTSKKGGFTKDYAYFYGYYKVKRFAKKNDIRELFIGKITIEDYPIIKDFINLNKSKIKTILD